MKTFLTFIIVCISLNQIQAQPELLSTEMPPIGSSMVYKTLIFGNIDSTIQGPSSIWNFSSIIPDSLIPDLILNVIDPASTSQAGIFPSTNYCLEQPYFTNNFYTYFNLNNTALEKLGTYSDTPNIYTNSQIDYLFPITLGSSNYDSISCTLNPMATYYSYECVGTGTLILPGGTYNAIMLRIKSDERVNGLNIYKWISSDNGVTLFTSDAKAYDPYVGGFLSTYLHSLTIGIDEISSFHEINYQNPIENNFLLNYNSKISSKYFFELHNALGQNIYNTEQTAIGGINSSLNIDFSTYASGVYFLNIRSEMSGRLIKSLKLVKP